jgi:hypothetical protein
MVKTNIQTFSGEVEILSNLHVGNYLTANGTASNVLDITGNVGATFFVGDGGFLSNIATTLNDIVANPGGNTVSNTLVFESGADVTSNTAIVTYANVGISISNTEPTGEFQLSIGSNIFVNTHAANVLTVVGAIGSDLFIGDGGLLSNIATTIDQIIDQGNTVSNTLQLISGMDATSNTGLVTHKDVGISISNTAPTGEFQFGVGSNLFVNTYSSNVLSIEGNVNAQKMTLGTISVTSAYGLNHVTAQGSATGDTISLSNVTTGLEVTSNITAGGNVTAETVITSANVEVGNRLKFASNVFVDDLRIADLAANLVTYDKTTGELMDSGGLFANKLAVVSVQPPSALTANATTIAKHGTYTVTTSSLAENSNAWNAFDGDSAVEWTSSPTVGHLYSAGESTYAGTSNLFTGNYIQPGVSSAGEWLAIEFPYKTTLRHMKLTPPATLQRYPASANVYATNDSLTWTEVAQWGDVDPVTSSNVQTVVVNATESFKKYAIVVTKANGGADNVALAKWDLFAESFSIDGGQISMAQQPTTGGETMMEQSGPHSRNPKAVPLKKYPEIAFGYGKLDANETTFTYTQAGYTVKGTNSNTGQNSGPGPGRTPWKAFSDLNDGGQWQPTGFSHDTGNNGSADNVAAAPVFGPDDTKGAWVSLELPKKIKLQSVYVKSVDPSSSTENVRIGKLYGSNNNSDWVTIKDDYTLTYSGSDANDTVNSTTAYKYIVFQIRATGGSTQVQMNKIRYYGYEEDQPLGDTSVDTTFTSIMNTPQTTGAQVYVDGNLGETFTNRVVGPTVSNTHTTYVSAGKYWELSGNVESNVTLEANTFLSGDAPHSLSMWFNSSNLEANVSNTCVFSISDQEHLNSENLKLQSNTWHNLTYAYQGEGGSRVTYLDGRKVAEDQAEDTFGEYPPFAMTGYSQGGYVVSASSEYESWRAAWEAFDDNVTSADSTWTSANTGSANRKYDSSNGGAARVPPDVDAAALTIIDGISTYGEWVQLEFPYKMNLSSILLYSATHPSDQNRWPKDATICASNDDFTWTSIGSWVDELYPGTSTSTFKGKHYILDNTKTFKYVRIVITKVHETTLAQLQNVGFYGHRENDLVRLPDPTNVLKYPHVVMTGPAQRGYVVSASDFNTSYPAWGAFDDKYTDLDTVATSEHVNSRWQPKGGYAISGTPRNADGTETTTLASGSSPPDYDGEWLQLESPNKVNITSYRLYNSTDYVTDYNAHTVVLLGSNTGIDDWVDIGSGETVLSWSPNASTPDGTHTLTLATVNTSGNTGFYKYHRLVVTKVVNQNLPVIYQLQLFGTGVDSVPLQIGGGNIDKVANFRVYDKFVGEDQALEIWDAQKDEFGRAKSSMTLQKGRLGLGTTEPEGRLAVLDEPHTPEEFPPRAMQGDTVNFEEYGTFKASASSSNQQLPHFAFDKGVKILDTDTNSNNHDVSAAYPKTGWISIGGTYTNSTGLPTSIASTRFGYSGEWLQLEMPFKINLKSFTLRSSGHSYGENTGTENQTINRCPKNFALWGYDGTSWEEIQEYTITATKTSQTFRFNMSPTTKYYGAFAIVIKSTHSPAGGAGSGSSVTAVGELRFFGTREQGQSVLHDGQLTLTKNLTVPRIGPALDADDTPRRDRLVVEYNTSTNPTFEGAVRDTSGRGNEGVMYGNTYYDATTKAFRLDGLGNDYIQSSGVTLPTAHSMSVWINMDSNQSGLNSIMHIGTFNTEDESRIFTNGNLLHATIYGSTIQYATSLSPSSWYHVVYTFTDGTTFNTTNAKIYVNGQLVPTTQTQAPATLNLVGDTVTIGATSSGAEAFKGKISNPKLYDTILEPSEVKTLYDMGRCDEGHHVVNFSKTRVGIGLGDGEAPRGALDVRGDSTLRGIVNVNGYNPPYGVPSTFALQVMEAEISTSDTIPGGGIRIIRDGDPSEYWNIGLSQPGSGRLVFTASSPHGGRGGWIDRGVATNRMNFTGQHRTFIKDVPFSQVSDLEGLIVSSDQNKYIKMSGGIESGSNAITTNESLPVVSLSNVVTDKKCFGVISASEDPEERSDVYGVFGTNFEKEKGDTRVYINSVGEGAIWVVNTNGSLESGDYITTSNVAGYGQKQDDDVLHNYTVAKITMDCDFEPATQPVQQILRSNVVETYYLGNVHKVKSVPHEFMTTVVGANDEWSNVSVSPSDVTYAEWSNLEANTQNTYTLTYTQTSNVVYDTKYTLTTTANVMESDPWDNVFIDPPNVSYAEYSNLEANTQNTYTLTYTQTTIDEKTPDEWSNLESNVQSLYNKVYYQSVEEEVAKDYPGAVAHTRVTDVIENELDEHGQIQWEDHPTDTEKAYKIRYLDASGVETDSANAVHIAAFVGCTYHCG